MRRGQRLAADCDGPGAREDRLAVKKDRFATHQDRLAADDDRLGGNRPPIDPYLDADVAAVVGDRDFHPHGAAGDRLAVVWAGDGHLGRNRLSGDEAHADLGLLSDHLASDSLAEEIGAALQRVRRACATRQRRAAFRFLDTFAPQLVGDFRRQVLEFVEAPKPVAEELPDTPFVELRHVEVRPPAYHAYRVWRDRTIFATVRKAPEVEAFVAYHSVVSTRPEIN